MDKHLFLRCDRCGQTINLFKKYNKSKCRCCEEGHYHPSKDLYVVNTEEEKATLESAFKILSFTGYEIAIVEIYNAGKLYSDEIVFADANKESWDITDEIRAEYKVDTLESVYEFFSTDFTQYDRVILCHTENLTSKLTKYIMSYKFEKEGLPLYEMNLKCAGQIMVDSGFPIYHATDSISCMWDFVVAAANPPERIEQVTQDMMRRCADRWRVLTRCQTGLCICEGWEVINVPLSIYDNVILDIVNDVQGERLPYRRLAFVVGATMAQIDNVRQGFITERIITLAKEGKIRLEQRTDTTLTQEDLKKRQDNPVQVDGVYIYPLHDVLIKTPQSIDN